MEQQDKESLKWKTRYYWVDEDDDVRQIPQARFHRIFDRTEAITFFIGKTVRFVEAHIQVDETGHKHLASANFPLYRFDAAGLWSEDQKASELCGAVEMLSVFGQKDWEELYEHEYLAPHRWRPTNAIIESVRQALCQKKK